MDKIKASQFADLAYCSRFIFLPTEYQQVEWLLNPSSGQYIDTGVTAATIKGFETKILLANTGGTWKAGFGCNSSSVGNIFCGANGSSGTMAVVTEGTSSVATFTLGTDHIIKYIDNILTIDDVVQFSRIFSSSDGTTLRLFKFGESDSQTDTKIYYFKAYDASGLIRDLIPCYRKSDNKTGMYDVLGRAFYPNLGSGEFTLGNNV